MQHAVILAQERNVGGDVDEVGILRGSEYGEGQYYDP
jgi:hypothetical protein